jgi:hypothetical protein
MRIWKLVLIGLLAIEVVSCSKAPTTTDNSAATPAASVSSGATEAKPSSGGGKSSPDSASGFTALQNVISSTKKAVEAGKLDVAKTEFAKFEDSWKTVEDPIKAKSKATYQAIEDGLEAVDKGIASKQGKDALLASLTKLSQSVMTASK